MASLYPGVPSAPGNDDFSEPSNPESTSLSEAGGGTRNHVMHHKDLGDAVEAIQANNILKTHDHNGLDDRWHGPKLSYLNTHEGVNTDASVSSIHHTIDPDGLDPKKAAAANHTHDYNGPTILNQPFIIVQPGQPRPFNPPKGMMIYEVATNTVRAWSTFMDNVTVNGKDFTEEFPATVANDAHGRIAMNVTDWEQWYEDDQGSTPHYDHGAMGVAPAGFLKWEDHGTDHNRCIARRIKNSDRKTDTDDQVISWKTGSTTIQETTLFAEAASNDFYFRMSDDRQSYLRLQVGNDWLKLMYTITGPGGEKQIGHLDYLDTDTPNTQWSGQIKDRTFTVYRLGELMTTFKDTSMVSRKGDTNRGWGIGMTAGDKPSFLDHQTTPANIDWVRIQDLQHFTTVNRWTLLAVAAVPVCRLRQSKKQKILYTGSIVEWSTSPPLEDTFGFYNPARSTDINISEAGLYQIEATIQWDPQWVPDVASIALMIDGLETTIKDQRFMRGNTFVPGFSQTLSVNGKLRLAAGSVLQVKVKYTVGNSLLDKIFSYFDPSSQINSRLDLHFLTP